MRWAILTVTAFAATAIAASTSSRAESITLAGTEWGSAPGCHVEIVRFHADGTAHVLYDTAYDFVDADEATWQQQGNALVLTVDGKEYRGRLSGRILRLASSADAEQASTCAFVPNHTTKS
jgi:hypothetical protein